MTMQHGEQDEPTEAVADHVEALGIQVGDGLLQAIEHGGQGLVDGAVAERGGLETVAGFEPAPEPTATS